MFVKVTTKYNDTKLSAVLPEGVILEVTEDRGAQLINAKVAEEFTFSAPKANKKNKSEETKAEIKEEEIVNVEETNEVPADAEVVDTVEVTPTEDGWKEPTATETTGE